MIRFNKKLFVISFSLIVLFAIFINISFNRASSINKFVSTKIYKDPANVSFTDQNFYNCVVDAYNDKNGTSLPYTTNLTDNQLKTITKLYCINSNKDDSEKLTNLNGIEKLTSLTDLFLSYNKISNLDVSNNTSLISLNASNNIIENVNISTNLLLKNLNISDNKLESIDVSNNSALTNLNVSYNQLSSLDISNNTSILDLYAYENKITNINLNNNLILSNLEINNNQLTSLDLSKNVDLKFLNVSNNNLENIDVSNNSTLIFLDVSDNKLTNLYIDNSLNLKTLDATNNNFESIDVSKNTELTNLDLSENQLINIDLTNNVNLQSIGLSNNKLTNLNINNNINLKTLNLYNNQLVNLDLSKNVSLINLKVSKNQLIGLDVSKNVNLTDLRVSENQLTNIDLSNNLKLKNLYLNDNKLTSLDLSKNENLINLNVENNLFEKDVYVYKNDTISSDLGIKLPINKTNTLVSIYRNNIKEEKLDTSSLGEFKYLLNYEQNIDSFYNTYDMTINLYVVEAISSKYIINSEKNYIYTKTDVDASTILNNISLNYGTGYVENNKYIIKGNNEIIREFDLINISSNNYDLSKDYIYTGSSELDLSKINVVNASKEISDNKLIIKNNNEIIKEFDIVSISSNSYDLSKNYIYIDIDELDLTKINVINGTKEIDNNKLIIKYDSNILKEYPIYKINFGALVVKSNNIIISDTMEYNTFISNITSSDVTFKVFNNQNEVTSGNLDKEMKLNIYKDNDLIYTYNITNEFLEFDTDISINENNNFINNISLSSTAQDMIDKITTSGTVTIKNNKNEVITGSSKIGTGFKINIELSTENKEYTVIIKGDVTGTGSANVSDVAKLYQYYKGKITMDDCYKEAGNVVGTDNEIKIGDVAKLYQYIKGKINSLED